MRKAFAIFGCCLLALAISAQATFIIDEFPPNTPEPDSLFLSGSINNWTPNDPDFLFVRDTSGRLFLTLPGKQSFEYKITRGSWKRVETNEFGQFINNRQYQGGAQGDTAFLKILSWEDLPVNPRHGWATITITETPKNTPPDASLYAVGGFNDWHPGDPAYQLAPLGNGAFQVRIPLMEDTTYYKFTRGSWETIEGRRNGRARINRQYILHEQSSKNVTAAIESWEDLAGNPINLYTFFLLLAAFQGLLLILAINTLQDNNRAANRVLSVLLLMLSVALAGRVSTYDRDIFNWIPRLLVLPDFIYFLYAPIFLLYINRLLRTPARNKGGINWWHFVPFLLQVAFYFPLILMPKGEFIAKVVNQEFKPFFAWSGGLALVFNAVYWFLCRRTIRQYERESGDTLAFEPNLEFLRVVMWLKFACLIIWATTYLIGGLGLILATDLSFMTEITTDTLWVAFSLTAFFLGYYTMRQPEIFKLPASDTPPSEQGQEEEERAASMGEEEMNEIKEQLEQAMEESQPYRNPGLNLHSLAEMAGTSPHSLSRVINEGYGMNFNDFVNSYRIEEFKRIAQQEDYQNHTLLAIAFIVGFNSKSAFNRSFKKLEDCTPREYLKRVVG
ncbi:MAG: AraC family transcriptional regulator [Lewinellaceae bacterium]|nr:AraC family transcriptional regulator [Phaeodactylibacter sp.]MCB0614539.1 AraC family transcriptional regulator [Phaeodactylibacter sp.]MCB9350142.1 AraC family transcriptional regulator [Lewinellaceae bacterium]